MYVTKTISNSNTGFYFCCNTVFGIVRERRSNVERRLRRIRSQDTLQNILQAQRNRILFFDNILVIQCKDCIFENCIIENKKQLALCPTAYILTMKIPLPPDSNQFTRKFFVLCLSVVALIAVTITAFTFPLAITSNWWLSLLTVLLVLFIVIFLATALWKKILARYIIEPFAQIAESARLVSGGVTAARVPLEAMPSAEAYLAAEAVNTLADKAGKDIAEMKKLERVRSEFLGNVSHELRTPIFSIQGYLETLLDGALEDPEVSHRFVERAHQNTKRLNILLSDLIDISKIESGEMRLSFRYFNLCDSIRETLSSLELQAVQSDVTLTTSGINGNEIMVYGDKERLAQVMLNILQNAIKYNRPNGNVTLKVEVQPQEVTVRIRDTGIGIPPSDRTRIFERFYRVDKDRSRSVGGTGLGLAIVKHILEAHQAPFGVESEIGVGTEIWFVLKR